MAKKCVSMLVASLLLFTTLFSGTAFAADSPIAGSPYIYGRVSTYGADITVNGDPSAKLFGVNDTTALQFAIMAYINGDTGVAGRNSVFNGPDTSGDAAATIPQNTTPEEFWNQYFALLEYYNCNLVRIGAADTWGTDLQYQAYINNRDEYFALLDTMLDKAEEHHVWVVLNLAGIQGEIENDPGAPYQFGAAASDEKTGKVFSPGSDAFNNYIEYCNDVMSALEDYDSLAWFDMFNEPDHDKVNVYYWQDDKVAFNTWAKAVASATANASTHPRTMGVAGLGGWDVGLFAGSSDGSKPEYWTQTDFDLSTGKTGFEIASRHFYASAADNYLFADPETWARNAGIPLYWGELAVNNVYPLERWIYGENAIYAAGGQAVTSMVLNGTTDYPYTGGSLDRPALEIKQTKPGNVFRKNTDPAAFEILTQGDTVTWSVYDYWGSKVAGQTESVVEGDKVVSLPDLETGYYTFNVTALKSGSLIKSATNAFAVLPSDDAADVDSPFGMSAHYGKSWDPETIPLLQKAGVKNVRDELYWNDVETSPGVYEFNERNETYMSALQSHKLNPFIIFTYINPFYDNNSTPYTDAGREGFANYGKAILQHYDNLKWVEVYNEFNYELFGDQGDGPADSQPEYYFELLKKTYETVKAEAPDVVVVGAVTSGVPMDWLTDLFELGGLEYMDVVSVHPYHYPNAPEVLTDEISRLQNLIREYNGGELKPVWFTEIGWPTYQSQQFGISEDVQADYIVRMHVVSIASGIEKIFWYDFMNDGLEVTYNEHNFGIIRNSDDPLGSYAPKPAYASYSVMTRQLTGADYINKEDIGDGIYSYVFRSGDTNTRVIWSTETKNIKVKAKDPVQVIDMMGVEETLYPSLGGYVYLTVSGSPVYIQGDVDEISEGSIFSLTAAAVVTGEPIPVTLTVDNTLAEPISARIDIEGISQSFDVEPGNADQILIMVPTGDTSATRTIRGVITRDGLAIAKLMISTSTVDVIDPITLQAKHIFRDGQDMIRATISNSELAPHEYGLEYIDWQIGDLSGRTDISIAVQPGTSEYVDIPVPELAFDQIYPYALTLGVDNGQTVEFTGNLQMIAIAGMTAVAERAVTVDGVLDDLSDVPVIDLADGVVQLAWPEESYTGDEDLSGQIWLTWDQDYIYVSAKIHDDVFYQTSFTSLMWQGDCVQFSLSSGLPEEGRPIESHEWNEYGMALTADGPQLYRFFSSNGQPMGLVAGAQLQIVRDEASKDTIYECAIPWPEVYPIEPGDGLISFSALANDNDSHGRKCYIEWGSGIGGEKNNKLFKPVYMKTAGVTYTMIFATDGLSLSGSAKITGDVGTNSVNADSVDFAWSAGIDGNLFIGPGGEISQVVHSAQPDPGNNVTGKITNLEYASNYPLPIFPATPELEDKGDFTAGWWPTGPFTISESGAYGGINVQSQLAVNIGDEDVVLVTKDLSVTGSGKITVNRTGTGRLILYVTDKLDVSGSGSINKDGNYDGVEIFYSGSGELNFGGSTKISGSLFAKDANMEIGGSGGVTGHIVTGGSSVEVTGNANANTRVVYAPNAVLTLSASGQLKGAAIARSINLSGAAKIAWEDVISIDFFENLAWGAIIP